MFIQSKSPLSSGGTLSGNKLLQPELAGSITPNRECDHRQGRTLEMTALKRNPFFVTSLKVNMCRRCGRA